MQTTHLIGMLIAVQIIGLLAMAIANRLNAEKARATGYDEGYDDAKLAHAQRITALHSDIARLQEQQASARLEHGHQLEAIMQDCDERIAIYARRASPFGIADRLVLAEVYGVLKLAANTFAGLQANDSAVRTRDLMTQLQEMDRRLVATLPTAETTEQEKAA